MKTPSIVLLLALALMAACYDPVHQDAVAALGPEVEGVPRGPTHRAGQPCTTCHGGDGPGEPDFAVAGTLFTVRGSSEPLAGAIVTIVDAAGDTRVATSNGAGNFFLTKAEWSPRFPLRVAIRSADGSARKEMTTTIGRDGGCAACHRGAGDSTFMPGVFLEDKAK